MRFSFRFFRLLQFECSIVAGVLFYFGQTSHGLFVMFSDTRNVQRFTYVCVHSMCKCASLILFHINKFSPQFFELLLPLHCGQTQQTYIFNCFQSFLPRLLFFKFISIYLRYVTAIFATKKKNPLQTKRIPLLFCSSASHFSCSIKAFSFCRICAVSVLWVITILSFILMANLF